MEIVPPESWRVALLHRAEAKANLTYCTSGVLDHSITSIGTLLPPRTRSSETASEVSYFFSGASKSAVCPSDTDRCIVNLFFSSHDDDSANDPQKRYSESCIGESTWKNRLMLIQLRPHLPRPNIRREHRSGGSYSHRSSLGSWNLHDERVSDGGGDGIEREVGRRVFGSSVRFLSLYVDATC